LSVQLAVYYYVCTALCGVNTYSATGLEPCSPCPVGSYQPSNGSIRCKSCAFDVGLVHAQSSYCPGTHCLFTVYAKAPQNHIQLCFPTGHERSQ